MKSSFLFPGQGSQSVGMGAGWIDSHSMRHWFDLARDVAGRDIRVLCLEGPKEELDQTVITQPALYVLSAMLLNTLQEHGIQPVAVAGHSAGEYAALLAAGAWDFETGLKVISTRARIMFESGQRRPGAMAAVLGMDGDQVERLCQEEYTNSEVVVANRNTPIQTVISGDRDCVNSICGLLKERGARRVIPLPVSGAFHSPLLAEGAAEFAEILKSVEIKPPAIPWISNRTGMKESSPEIIREHLAGQLTSPVQWVKTMATLDELSCGRFLEVGPGKVLSGLAKGCGTKTPCISVGSPEQVESIIGEGEQES
ncbi:MAG: ACP S-malonyltransferase [bacterium]